MAELKTKKTKASVKEFIEAIADEGLRSDAKALVAMMREATGDTPKMWGESIVGFGDYHYTYASGREGDWFVMGFSPRKTNLTIYFTPGFLDKLGVLSRLGKHKTGKGCLYIKSLADIDRTVLQRILASAVV